MSEQEDKKPTNAIAPTAPSSMEQVRLVEHDELHKIVEYLENNGKALLVVTAVVLVAVAGFVFFKKHRETARAEASAMLFKVNSVQDLDNMVSRYGSTPVAPLALLKLGKAHFDAGSYELAGGKYDEFKQKYPQHPFAPAATLGKLHCQEALGQTEQALAGFTAFVTDHPLHFLTAQAVFGKGRCLESLGRAKEAKILYEDFLAKDRKGPWVMRAEEQLAILKRKIGDKPEEIPSAEPSAQVPAPGR